MRRVEERGYLQGALVVCIAIVPPRVEAVDDKVGAHDGGHDRGDHAAHVDRADLLPALRLRQRHGAVLVFGCAALVQHVEGGGRGEGGAGDDECEADGARHTGRDQPQRQRSGHPARDGRAQEEAEGDSVGAEDARAETDAHGNERIGPLRHETLVRLEEQHVSHAAGHDDKGRQPEEDPEKLVAPEEQHEADKEGDTGKDVRGNGGGASWRKWWGGGWGAPAARVRFPAAALKGSERH